MMTFPQFPVQQPSPRPVPSTEDRLSVSSSPAKQSFPPLNEEENFKGTEHTLHVLLPLKKLITFVLSFLSVASNYILKKKNWMRNFTVEPKHVELYIFNMKMI